MANNLNMSKYFDFSNKLIEAYHKSLQPLVKKTNLSPVALDILLFIANNTNYATAKDICNIRGFKSGIVSVHVDRLVNDLLLVRKFDINDRRKVKLDITDNALKIIEEGRKIQQLFALKMKTNIDDSDFLILNKIINKMEENISDIRKYGL